MTRTFARHIAFFVVLAALPIGLHAEIYKWVDRNGLTHYSERKPIGSQSVQIVNPKAGKATAERQSWEEQDQQFSERREAVGKKAEEAQAAAELAAQKKVACNDAMQRLARLQRPRVNRVADDGTRTRMREEQRQEELAATRDAIKEYCS